MYLKVTLRVFFFFVELKTKSIFIFWGFVISLQHVMYLRELRLAQMERLMVEFLHGVDIYLSLVRDSNDTNPKVGELYRFFLYWISDYCHDT